MQTKKHWEQTHYNPSYANAQTFAFQLKEEAKNHKLDYRGIKVYDKQYIEKHNLGYADSMVCWKDGPKNWTTNITIVDSPLVSVVVENDYTVAFYDK